MKKYTNKRVPIEFFYAGQRVKIGEYASTTNREVIKYIREIINNDLTKTQKTIFAYVLYEKSKD